MASLQCSEETAKETSCAIPDIYYTTRPPLAGYLSRQALAKGLGKSERTIQRWGNLRDAPPVVRLGRTAYYREESVRDWLLNREQKPVKSRR